MFCGAYNGLLPGGVTDSNRTTWRWGRPPPFVVCRLRGALADDINRSSAPRKHLCYLPDGRAKATYAPLILDCVAGISPACAAAQNTMYCRPPTAYTAGIPSRSEEHTSELQSPCNLVCR